jgi:hypothetical protein
MNTFEIPSKSPSKKPVRRRFAIAASALVIGTLVSLGSCSSTVENRDPMGEIFPRVAGKSLEGEAVDLPLSEPAVFLVGYVQDAQFDADRWLVGLMQATPDVRIFEVPAVAGLFPSLLEGTIDGGMRRGIPQEDWSSVVTCYGDAADQILQFTGNENPRNIRVILLDSEGKVRWFHDRGFSAGKLLDLNKMANGL